MENSSIKIQLVQKNEEIKKKTKQKSKKTESSRAENQVDIWRYRKFIHKNAIIETKNIEKNETKQTTKF